MTDIAGQGGETWVRCNTKNRAAIWNAIKAFVWTVLLEPSTMCAVSVGEPTAAIRCCVTPGRVILVIALMTVLAFNENLNPMSSDTNGCPVGYREDMTRCSSVIYLHPSCTLSLGVIQISALLSCVFHHSGKGILGLAGEPG